MIARFFLKNRRIFSRFGQVFYCLALALPVMGYAQNAEQDFKNPLIIYETLNHRIAAEWLANFSNEPFVIAVYPDNPAIFSYENYILIPPPQPPFFSDEEKNIALDKEGAYLKSYQNAKGILFLDDEDMKQNLGFEQFLVKHIAQAEKYSFIGDEKAVFLKSQFPEIAPFIMGIDRFFAISDEADQADDLLNSFLEEWQNGELTIAVEAHEIFLQAIVEKAPSDWLSEVVNAPEPAQSAE